MQNKEYEPRNGEWHYTAEFLRTSDRESRCLGAQIKGDLFRYAHLTDSRSPRRWLFEQMMRMNFCFHFPMLTKGPTFYTLSDPDT
jgi:hypothetical protein